MDNTVTAISVVFIILVFALGLSRDLNDPSRPDKKHRHTAGSSAGDGGTYYDHSGSDGGGSGDGGSGGDGGGDGGD